MDFPLGTSTKYNKFCPGNTGLNLPVGVGILHVQIHRRLGGLLAELLVGIHQVVDQLGILHPRLAAKEKGAIWGRNISQSIHQSLAYQLSGVSIGANEIDFVWHIFFLLHLCPQLSAGQHDILIALSIFSSSLSNLWGHVVHGVAASTRP